MHATPHSRWPPLVKRCLQSNNSPVGIATQTDHFRARFETSVSAKRLSSWFEATVELVKVMARATGNQNLSEFCLHDLTTFKRDMPDLSGVHFGGVIWRESKKMFDGQTASLASFGPA